MPRAREAREHRARRAPAARDSTKPKLGKAAASAAAARRRAAGWRRRRSPRRRREHSSSISAVPTRAGHADVLGGVGTGRLRPARAAARGRRAGARPARAVAAFQNGCGSCVGAAQVDRHHQRSPGRASKLVSSRCARPRTATASWRAARAQVAVAADDRHAVALARRRARPCSTGVAAARRRGSTAHRPPRSAGRPSRRCRSG